MYYNIDDSHLRLYENLLQSIRCHPDDRMLENEILELIESAPMTVIQIQDERGDYLLHIAIRDCSDYDTVILKLINLYPISVQHINDDGCLPLHIACFSTVYRKYHSLKVSENVLMKLIDIYPEAASIECNYNNEYRPKRCVYYFSKGSFALHLACQFIQSKKVIQKLIEINPMALQVRSKIGHYPIHCV